MRRRNPDKLEPQFRINRDVLWDNPLLKISIEDATQILVCEWTGFQTLESIQSGGAIILQKLSEKKATAVLNDNFNVQRQWEDAVDWTTGEWFPAMTVAGLRHFAWVLSKDIFARISAKRAGQSFQFVRYFRSHQEAYNWLRQIR